MINLKKKKKKGLLSKLTNPRGKETFTKMKRNPIAMLGIGTRERNGKGRAPHNFFWIQTNKEK